MKDGKEFEGIVLKAEETIRIPVREYRALVIATDRYAMICRDTDFFGSVDADLVEKITGVAYQTMEDAEPDKNEEAAAEIDKVLDALNKTKAELEEIRKENLELKEAAQRLGFGYTKLTKE
jgi:hypothetical protein